MEHDCLNGTDDKGYVFYHSETGFEVTITSTDEKTLEDAEAELFPYLKNQYLRMLAEDPAQRDCQEPEPGAKVSINVL